MPDKKKKKTVVKNSGPDYIGELKEKSEQISELEKQLAGMDVLGWLDGDALNLMQQIQKVQDDMAGIKKREQADYQNFEEAHGLVMEKEGGYTAGKHDKKGGKTYEGISYLQNKDWEGWPYIDSLIKQGLQLKYNQIIDDPHLDSMVRKFYTDDFWNKIHGSEIKDQNFAKLLYNDIVNINNRIIPRLQKLLHAKQDGIIGPALIDSINAHDGERLLDSLHSEEQNFYYHISGYLPGKKEIPGHKLTQSEKDNRENLDGWINRSNDVYNRLKNNEHQNKTSTHQTNNNNVEITPKNANNTDALALLMGHGIPGDSDYVPSIFDADKYTFNGPSGKWTPKSEGNFQEQGVDLNSIEFQYLKKYNTFPKAPGGNAKSKTQVHAPAPAKHSKTASPAPKQKVTGAHPTGFNITIKKVTGQMVGEQQVSSGERKPLTADVVAGLLRSAAASMIS